MNVRRTYMAGAAWVLMLLFISWCAGCGGSAKADSKDDYRSLKAVSHLIHVPLTRQATDYTCGVAALQSILYYYGQEIRQDVLAEKLQSTPEDGTTYPNIVKYAQSQGFDVAVHTDLTLVDLRGYIDRQQPVLLAIQAWRDTPGDWLKDEEDGHYVVAVGYDRENFYFMDPSTLGNFAFIPNDEFLSRWHDTYQGAALQHFGIVMTKPSAERYDFDKIKRME